MQLTKLGHACLFIEQGPARVLIDPGAWSSGFEDLRDLTAILITHAHADHLDPDRIGRLVERNPQAVVIADRDSVRSLGELGVQASAVTHGASVDVGVRVDVVGVDHAVIHPDIAVIPNNGYLLDGVLFHPGDSFTLPEVPVEVLAVPVGAPWLKAAEFVDYVRTVQPRVAVPVHDAVLTFPESAHRMLRQLVPDVECRVVANGDTSEVGES